MSNGDDDSDDVSELIEEWQDFEAENGDGDESPDTEDEPVEQDDDADDGGADAADFESIGEGLGEEAEEVFEEAFGGMTPDNPELLDMDLESAMVEAIEEEIEDDEDEDEEDDEDEEEEVCEGSTPMQLSMLGERGDVTIALNYIAADSIKEGTVLASEPSEEDIEGLPELLAEEISVNEDLNDDNYLGSYSQGIEVHFDETDWREAHNAIATVMTPTEDKLARNPDAEITPDTLNPRDPEMMDASCHPDYDLVRTFDIAREGDANQFVERGPWTNRRFNVQDLIDELATKTAESEDGFLVVVSALPFK